MAEICEVYTHTSTLILAIAGHVIDEHAYTLMRVIEINIKIKKSSSNWFEPVLGRFWKFLKITEPGTEPVEKSPELDQQFSFHWFWSGLVTSFDRS